MIDICPDKDGNLGFMVAANRLARCRVAPWDRGTSTLVHGFHHGKRWHGHLMALVDLDSEILVGGGFSGDAVYLLPPANMA